MKILSYALMLFCYAVSSAAGRDFQEMNRERLIFCRQFVIEDPGPTMNRDATQYCCRVANRGHDCHFVDWEEQYR